MGISENAPRSGSRHRNRPIGYGDELVVERGDQLPRVFGLYRGEDDRYIQLEGTLGDDIDSPIYVPHSTVTRIVILRRARDPHRPAGERSAERSTV